MSFSQSSKHLYVQILGNANPTTHDIVCRGVWTIIQTITNVRVHFKTFYTTWNTQAEYQIISEKSVAANIQVILPHQCTKSTKAQGILKAKYQKVSFGQRFPTSGLCVPFAPLLYKSNKYPLKRRRSHAIHLRTITDFNQYIFALQVMIYQ